MDEKMKFVNLVIEDNSNLFNRKFWVFNFILLKGSVEQAEKVVRKAVQEYLKTPEGKRDMEYACGYYNWGDAIRTIPDDFWEEHGLKPINHTATDIWVDHDEILC